MKFLSFKILFLYILLPPIFYVTTIQSLETVLKKKYKNEIVDIYTGDTRPLFNGTVKLKDAIDKNIDHFIKSKALLLWGVNLNVKVTTKNGTILYPAIFEDAKGSLVQPDLMQVAAENYRLMNEGLVVDVDLILEHNTIISNLILAFYICLFVLGLYFYYRSGIKKATREDVERNTEIARLLKLEKTHEKKFQAIVQGKKKLTSEIVKIKKKLEKERLKASKNEDEMIKEIVAIEEKLDVNIAKQEKRQQEINALKDKIKRLEKERRKGERQKLKSLESIQKRFRTLYKNISINDRAIGGFAELEEDMKIKSEEIIHKLNANPDKVPIKRKVFGKKTRKTVQEVMFAYKGRLYYRKTKDYNLEIIAIGTKNTQAKDLEFIDSL